MLQYDLEGTSFSKPYLSAITLALQNQIDFSVRCSFLSKVSASTHLLPARNHGVDDAGRQFTNSIVSWPPQTSMEP